jgi:hypothetical protein
MNNFPRAACPREASLFLPFLLRVPVWEKQGFIERRIITTENIGAAIWHMVGMNGGGDLAENLLTCFCPSYVPLGHHNWGKQSTVDCIHVLRALFR